MESGAASSATGEATATGMAFSSWTFSSSIASAISSTLANATSPNHSSTASSSSTSPISSSSPTSSVASTDSAATATASSALDPTSLSHLARSLPTYLAAGAAVLGVGIIIAFGSWWWRRRKRQRRFESRFGEDSDDDLEGRWYGIVEQARTGSRAGTPARSLMAWDPETGKGRRLTLDLPEESTPEEKRGLTGTPGRRGSLGLDEVVAGRSSCSSDPSRPTIRLVPTTSHPTPTKPSSARLSPLHIPDDKGQGESSVVVERVHTPSPSPSPSPRDSPSPIPSPSPSRSESELRLLAHR